jgi:hypothetical protein
VNNKIYVSAFNHAFLDKIHIIHHPDSAGQKCRYERFGFQLGILNISGSLLPNLPNYALGKIPDSLCDTIGKVKPPPPPTPSVFSVFPNPTSGLISIASPDSGSYQLYDALGRVVGSDKIAQGTHHHSLGIPSGVYTLRASYGSKRESLKVVVW